MEVNKLLDRCKAVCSSPTDMALAEKLGVTRAALSDWRHQKSLPNIVVCAKIADITGESFIKLVSAIEEQRAISNDAKKAWRRLAQVASFFIPVLALTSSFLPSLYIMSSTLCNIFDEIEQLFNISSSRLSRETALPI